MIRHVHRRAAPWLFVVFAVAVVEACSASGPAPTESDGSVPSPPPRPQASPPPPHARYLLPEASATGVPTNAVIVFVPVSFNYTHAIASLTAAGTDADVAGAFEAGPGSLALFRPGSALEPDTTYTVRISVRPREPAPATEATLRYLPVLVVADAEDGSAPTARVVVHANLGEYLPQLPHYSYLVPRAHEQALRRQVESEAPFSRDGWRASFRVLERLADGRQLLEVTMSLENSSFRTGWYVASEREIRALKWSNYGDYSQTMTFQTASSADTAVPSPPAGIAVVGQSFHSASWPSPMEPYWRLEVEWQAPRDARPVIYGINVDPPVRFAGDEFAPKQVLHTTDNRLALLGRPESEVEVSVCAIDEAGNTSCSASSRIQFPDAP